MDRRTRQQVSTRPVSTASIMKSLEFVRGLNDVRKGVSFDWRNGDWEYERGRLFGHIAPLDMPLNVGGKLNPKALALCNAAFNRKLII